MPKKRQSRADLMSDLGKKTAVDRIRAIRSLRKVHGEGAAKAAHAHERERSQRQDKNRRRRGVSV